MKLTFDGDWRATVTDDPLHITPASAPPCTSHGTQT